MVFSYGLMVYKLKISIIVLLENKGVVTMFVSYLVLIGVLSVPMWSVVFCLNLISIIEKIKYKKDHTKNSFWFTVSFVIIITVITFVSAAAPPSY